MRTKGWQKILQFTLIQQIKNKSFIIGTIVMAVVVCALCVLTNVLPGLMSDDDSGDIIDIIDTNDGITLDFDDVFLYDESGILEESDIEALPLTISDTDLTLADNVEDLKSTDKISVAVSVALWENEGYNITSYYSELCDEDAVDTLGAIFSELVQRRILLNAGVSPEKYEETQMYVSATSLQAGGNSTNFIQGMLNYFLPIVISMLLFLLILSNGNMVAQSIATEKTSRVMELLLTSVRPLAVVIGKVLAMGIISILQLLLIGLVGAGSLAASAPFGILGQAMEIANDPEIQAALEQASSTVGARTTEMQIAEAVNTMSNTFSAGNILLVVVIFILGFLFYSLIAALVGASISRMEDLQQAMQPFSLLMVLGVYLAYFPVIFNMEALMTGDTSTNAVQMFSYFFPVSSPFALPSAVLLGSLNTVQALLGTVVLAVCVILIAIVVSKVYEAIILHNGNRIKFGEIIGMALRK